MGGDGSVLPRAGPKRRRRSGSEEAWCPSLGVDEQWPRRTGEALVFEAPFPCSSGNASPPPSRPPASRSRLGGPQHRHRSPPPAGRWRLQPAVAQIATRQAFLRHRPGLLAARFRLLRRAFDLHLHATVGLPPCHGREQLATLRVQFPIVSGAHQNLDTSLPLPEQRSQQSALWSITAIVGVLLVSDCATCSRSRRLPIQRRAQSSA